LLLFSGITLLALIGGPILAGGIGLAAIAVYYLTEFVARLRWRRKLVFIAILAVLHIAYWACFQLPLPPIFRHESLRPLDRPVLFILFSGIGMTFFRVVSYFHDRVRRNRARVPLADFLTYVFYFPHLRHGPLESCEATVARIRDCRAGLKLRDLGLGLLRICWALTVLWALIRFLISIEKRAVMHGAVNILEHPEVLPISQLLLLIHLPFLFLYVLESCAAHVQLGVSRCFGIKGSENYDHPYLATSPRKIWARWNMTLSSWLDAYAFKPLGGHRRRRYLNILLVFAYAGTLHGLQLRFLVWGMYAGVSVAIATWWRDRSRRNRSNRVAGHRIGRFLGTNIARLATVHWACWGCLIIADPDYFGWRVLCRYVQVLLGPVWSGVSGLF
jgi:D-alanyl-lipoteichoic acid acyltransferase DltB (MBOAT superfamily)